jgi:hypothetical protein
MLIVPSSRRSVDSVATDAQSHDQVPQANGYLINVGAIRTASGTVSAFSARLVEKIAACDDGAGLTILEWLSHSRTSEDQP